MLYRRLQEGTVRKRRVLVRTSFDVPISPRGRVLDTFRLTSALPTLRWLLRRRASVVLLAHRGRPNGKRRNSLSLRPLLPFLQRELHMPVDFASSPSQLRSSARVQPATVTLLENLRFFPGEEARLPQFGHALAALGELYVNDDFSTVHRTHASTVLVPKYLPGYAGLRLQRECGQLDRLLRTPRRPFVVVIGGAKVSDKLGVLDRLLQRIDQVCIGGAAGNTCLQAQGIAIGRSLGDTSVARARLRTLLANPKILLPSDVAIIGTSGRRRTADVHGIGTKEAILDIGPATARRFAQAVAAARTVFWAGPLGVVERRAFAAGTAAVADAIGQQTYSVAGGGDTIEALHSLHRADRFSFLSTGGGAMLAYLAGKRLPALQALQP